MSAELISIIVLGGIFVLATFLPLNMGVLAFAAAFLVGTLAGDLSSDDIIGVFPGDIFIVLVGVTFLFGIAESNGTIDWLIRRCVQLVGGRLAAIPWIMFGSAALLTAIGSVSPAAVAIVVPIGLGFAARYDISPLLIGAMVIHGAQAGGFSPISVYGTIVNGVVERNDLPGDELTLFLASFAVNALIAVIVFLLFGGHRLRRTGEADTTTAGDGNWQPGPSRPRIAGGAPAEDSAEEAEPPFGLEQAATLLSLAALVALTLGFDLDVGLVAFTIAAVLSLLSPRSQKAAVGKVPWPVVLLICGVLTYIAVLEELGTIKYVGNAVADVGAPLLAALLLCYIGAIVSAFASSVAVLGAIIPLAVPFLMTGEVSAVGVVTAVAIASTIVDVSPVSTNGALVVANARNLPHDVIFARLMRYAIVVTLAGPLVVWLVLVVPGLV